MKRTLKWTGVAAGLLAGTAYAQSLDDTLEQHAMFSIGQTTGNLLRYDFATQSLTTVGTLRDDANQPMQHIDAAVMLPGVANLYAFWTNPNDHKNKMVFVHGGTGEAQIAHGNLEGGRVTGATHFATPDNPWGIFIVQQEQVTPPASITGSANINPNNSAHNEFYCIRDDGTTFTRDDLKKDAQVDANGTFYEGPATELHFKPKGNGNQNGLVINGEPFTLQNSNTYTFTGQMQVRVYNDHIHNSKAMGHWWVQVTSGQVIINNDVQILSPNRMASVDQTTGAVNEIMVLSRAYDSLATHDGVSFFATSGSTLYVIDTALLTETQVGDSSTSNLAGLSFVGSHLLGYDQANQKLVPLDPDTGESLHSGVNLGMGELGTIVFHQLEQDTALSVAMYD